MKRVLLSLAVAVICASSLFSAEVSLCLDGQVNTDIPFVSISDQYAYFNYGFYAFTELRDILFHGSYAKVVFNANVFGTLWTTANGNPEWIPQGGLAGPWVLNGGLTIGYEFQLKKVSLIPTLGFDASFSSQSLSFPFVMFSVPISLGITLVDNDHMQVVLWPSLRLHLDYSSYGLAVSLLPSAGFSADFKFRFHNWGVYISPYLDSYFQINTIGLRSGVIFSF